MKYLSIKNFEKYQHFKKSNPPWVKLYRSLLTDREFMRLSVQAKYLYIGLIILVSEGSNRVPEDVQYLSHRLSIPVSDIYLTPLYQAGFLIASRSSVYRQTISKVSLRDREETETETEYISAPHGARQKKGKRSISDEDKPTEKHFAYGEKLGVNVGPEWGKFVNYCKAHDRRYADFDAAFRNWIANAANFKGGMHAMR